MEKYGLLDGRKYIENFEDSQLGQVTPKKYLKKSCTILSKKKSENLGKMLWPCKRQTVLCFGKYKTWPVSIVSNVSKLLH